MLTILQTGKLWCEAIKLSVQVCVAWRYWCVEKDTSALLSLWEQAREPPLRRTVYQSHSIQHTSPSPSSSLTTTRKKKQGSSQHHETFIIITTCSTYSFIALEFYGRFYNCLLSHLVCFCPCQAYLCHHIESGFWVCSFMKILLDHLLYKDLLQSTSLIHYPDEIYCILNFNVMIINNLLIVTHYI